MSASRDRKPLLLRTEQLGIQFGGLKAVDGVSLEVCEGELVGLIGPNGAGKTTCFNLLTGVYQPTTGQVVMNGQPLTGLKPFEICARGMARTFQNIRLCPQMNVLDNVLLATHPHSPVGFWSTLLRTTRFYQSEQEFRDSALKLLDLFGLRAAAARGACDLSYGDQRRLEIVRALATRPKILLLDEPAAGMNYQETEELMHLIHRIREEFTLTILLIEHDMKLVMNVCERIYVLDHGQLIASGSPREIQTHPEVIRAYLGADAAPAAGSHP